MTELKTEREPILPILPGEDEFNDFGRLERWRKGHLGDLKTLHENVRDDLDYVDKKMPWIDVGADHGADPLGVQDITAAFQAAVDSLPSTGGRVRLGRGIFRLDNTVNYYREGAPFQVSIEGEGVLSTQIHWYGSTSGTALYFQRVVGFSIKNLTLENKVAKGTTKGFHITSESPGSQTGPAVIENVRVIGFSKNVHIGESGGEAASEFEYHSLDVRSGDYGVYLEGSNSLNHQFHNLNLNMSSNGWGLWAEDPDNVYIYGGSASGNTSGDFLFKQSGSYGIFGYRSENGERFVNFGPSTGQGAGSPTNAIITGCRVGAVGDANDRTIHLNKAGHYTIANNHIHGDHIYVNCGNTVRTTLLLLGNTITDPNLYEIGADSGNVHILAQGNSDNTGAAGSYFDDENKILHNNTTYPFEKIDLSSGGVSAKRWHGLTAGISGTATLANNLRGSATFDTAATAVVTFGTAEPDATYFVAISGNVEETFWITAKATTGFTINSSNATSTATVDWVLMR